MAYNDIIVYVDGDTHKFSMHAFARTGSAYGFSTNHASDATRWVIARHAGGSVLASARTSTGGHVIILSTDSSVGTFLVSLAALTGLTPGLYPTALYVPSTGLGSGISAKGADPTGREIPCQWIRFVDQVR